MRENFLPLAVYMREGIFLSCSRGSRVSPGKILGKMDANGAFWALFWPIARWVLPHLEPKRGGFYPLAERVGCQGLPEKIFEKRMQIMPYELFFPMSPFCWLLVNIFSNFATTPRIYVMREYFHLLIYNIYRENFLLFPSWVFLGLFFWKTDANDAFWVHS